MALDDLVQGGNKGKGKGRGDKGGAKTVRYWGKGPSDRKGKGKGKRYSDDKENNENKENKENKKSKEASLDMSLDEVIVKDKGKGKGGKDRGDDWGKSKSKGKGKSSWSWGNSYGDSWKSNDKGGWNSDRKGSKGWSKGAYKGDKGDRFDGGSYTSSREPPREPAAAWNQHDDRDDDEEDGWGKGVGRGSARGGKGDDRREAGRPRGWSDNDRSDRGLWQRVEQAREAPIREVRRDSVRDRREVGRGSKVAETRSAPQKRRALEEPEGSRSTKSIKVTNIPHDVNVQDIRDAFEQETGKITRCRLDRGTAWIAFQTSGAARKAVDTFDRGELNGQNIGVTLDR